MKNIAVAVAIVFAAAHSAAAKNLYIPAAGTAPGANGTHFRTDVRIFNPSSTTPISISVHFLPQGMDGSNIPGRIVAVGPRQMAVLNDVVGDFLEWPVSAIGALRLDSDTDRSYEFSAESRSADGTLLAETELLTVPPMSMTLQPLAQLFGNVAVDDGYLLINTSLHAFPFASVVDNQSGDAVFIPGVQDLVE